MIDTIEGTTHPVVGQLQEARAKFSRARRVSGRGVAQRVARRLYERTGADALAFHLDPADVLLDDRLDLPVPAERPRRGTPLTIGWVVSPPAPGSGGHTTLFRMVEAVEAAGHRCVLFMYDRYGLDTAQRTAGLRASWPGVRASVRDAWEGIDGADACVATSWETAHVLATRGRAPMRRLYFIQDYEPWFYPLGSMHELAAMTYRLPYRRIALGHMVADSLARQQDVESDIVPFGCDTATYGPPVRTEPRSGVVVYSRPGTPRRGHELAVLALREFHRRHPEQTIHVYGPGAGEFDVPVEAHGRLTPRELNELYHHVRAGFALSFTNISLVAEEMLAAGVIPVVNDSPLARADMPNEHVAWARPTAVGLAEALAAAVEAPDGGDRAAAAAASVASRSWGPTQRAVVEIIEDEVHG